MSENLAPPPPPPPPPPPSAPETARPQLSPRTKRRMLLGTALLILAMVAIVGVQKYLATPGEAAVRKFLEASLSEQGLRPDVAIRDKQELGPGIVRMTVDGEAIRNEPLYRTINASNYLANHYPDQEAIAALQMLRALLDQGDLRSRLLELAGIEAEPIDPASFILLEKIANAGDRYPMNATLMAQKEKGGWAFRWETQSPSTLSPEGANRAAFPESAFVLSSEVDQARLDRELKTLQAMVPKLAAAQQEMNAEIRQLRLDRIQNFLTLIEPGSLHAGSLLNTSSNTVEDVYLQFSTVDPVTRIVEAFIREPGSWRDTRRFSGQYNTNQTGDRIELTLNSRNNESISEAGPVLGLRDHLSITLVADGHQLKGGNRGWDFTFTKTDAEEAAAIREQLNGFYHKLTQLLAPGSAFTGSVTNLETGQVETLLFEVRSLNLETGHVQLTAEDKNNPQWKRTISGVINENPYRNKGLPLSFSSESRERVREAPSTGFIASNISHQWGMRLEADDNTLTGQARYFGFNLTRMDPVAIAAYRAEQQAEIDAFFQLLSNEIAYDGIATSTQRGNEASPIRLRIHSMDTGSGSVEATLYSLSDYRLKRVLRGSFDPRTKVLSLQSEPIDRRITNTDRFFYETDLDSPRGPACILTLQGDEWTGKLQSWDLRLSMKQVIPSIPQDTPAGAFMLNPDGSLTALPQNNGRAAQSVSDVVGSSLATLLGVRDQNTRMASLSFSGTDPIPAASDRSVLHLIFKGSIESYPGGPENLPIIEVAPTKIMENGNREINLVPLAPGWAGIGHQALPIQLEHMNEDTFVITLPPPLKAGTYTIAAGKAYFEFRIE